MFYSAMCSIKQLVNVLADAAAAGHPAQPATLREYKTKVASFLDSYLTSPQMPEKNESVAVAHARKTAALFFDRVWDIPHTSNGTPEDIRVWGGTEAEVWPLALQLALKSGDISPEQFVGIINQHADIIGDLDRVGGEPTRLIAESLVKERRIHAIPVYESHLTLNQEFDSGNADCLLAAIEGAVIIDEDRLSWEQVKEFRADLQAKQQLRRLRHWLDAELAGKSLGFVQDEIAVKLDNYEKALKKHGIATATGIVSDVLDERFLFGLSTAIASAGLAGGAFWAALTGGVVTTGKVGLSIAKRVFDLGDRAALMGSEVAFVYELKKLSN